MSINGTSGFVLSAAACAIVLSGCGGGGGSSPAKRIANLAEGEFRPQIMEAAGNEPAPSSSVMQSSNATDGVTKDSIDVMAKHENGQVTFAVAYDDGSGGDPEITIGTADDLSARFSGDVICEQCDAKPFSGNARWNGAELRKSYGDGTLWVDVYTDIEKPTTETVTTGGAAPQTGDGARTVPIGTQISLTGISAGGGVFLNEPDGTNRPGTLDGATGTFTCPSSCRISSGSLAGGSWTFTPDRPPGALDVPSNAAVVLTGNFDTTRTDGTFNGAAGYFKCLSRLTGSCGRGVSNGRTTLSGEWVFIPTTPTPAGTTTTRTVQDADYLAGGVWLYVPESGDAYQFGAFVDGGQPFSQSRIEGLTGTATYAGDATGIYVEKESSTAAAEIGYFDADVTLTAHFGTNAELGTIGGVIDNFVEESTDEAVVGNPEVTLRRADIGSANSGFFKGDTTATVSGREFTGKWGGQFYGNGATATAHPGSVAGTFGGAAPENADDGYEASFVGVYGAYKQ